MRAQPTDAERRLWFALRKHRLGGFRFRRQYPVAGYIVDFVCLAAKLIIEADGGQHGEPEALDYDQKRTAALAAIGFEILRFTDWDILKETDAVANTIYRRLMEKMGIVDSESTVRPPP